MSESVLNNNVRLKNFIINKMAILILLILMMTMFNASDSLRNNNVRAQTFLEIEKETKLTKIGSYNYSIDRSIEVPKYVEVIGNYLYVAAQDAGFMIYDISIPQDPTLLGKYNSSSRYLHFSIRDNYAFIAAQSYGLLILDISDKTNPVLLSHLPLRENWTYQIEKVYLSGNYAILDRPSITGLVTVIDISDPENPTLVNDQEIGDSYASLTVSENIMILSKSEEGIHIYDISDKTNLKFLSSIDPNPSNSLLAGQYTLDVIIRDQVAYLRDYAWGLTTIDISDPSNPRLLDNLDPGDSWLENFAMEGDYVFAKGGQWQTSYLQMFDISDPEELKFIYHNQVENNVYALELFQQSEIIYAITINYFYDSVDNLRAINQKYGITIFTVQVSGTGEGGGSSRLNSINFSLALIGLFTLQILRRWTRRLG